MWQKARFLPCADGHLPGREIWVIAQRPGDAAWDNWNPVTGEVGGCEKPLPCNVINEWGAHAVVNLDHVELLSEFRDNVDFLEFSDWYPTSTAPEQTAVDKPARASRNR